MIEALKTGVEMGVGVIGFFIGIALFIVPLFGIGYFLAKAFAWFINQPRRPL